MNKESCILTFGYGNRTDYDAFSSHLEILNVAYVVDVRIKPRAWSAMWSENQINRFCEAQGVQYLSKRALGNTSGNSDWIPPSDEDADRALAEVSQLAEIGTVLLLCAELDPLKCHRKKVAERLSEITQKPIKHLI
ncbi:DUF488 domain-containing protein [Cyanobacteria bacterium FACHB-63]|nr:DUF488 domain-containing protein [Cyanobacteria bacterium FACHB-63]